VASISAVSAFHRGEALDDRRDLPLHGRFRVAAQLDDAPLRPAQEPRVRQHMHMRIEHEAELFRRRARQRRALRAQPRQLPQRLLHGGAEALTLRLHLLRLQREFGDGEAARLMQVGGPDGDTRRNA
jgi:hypothetical protein